MVMFGVAESKEGGKLLRVKVDYDSRINNVKLTGDFFVHPEDEMFKVEKLFERLPFDEKEEKLALLVRSYCTKYNVQLIGVTPEAIAATIRKAIANGEADE